jgi:uncharacterized protein (TIGR00255 family)
MSASMTGYGRGETSDADRRIVIEIKTINNRYCDIQIRMPRILAALENKIREMTATRIARGKIDLTVIYEDRSPASSKVVCDLGLARAYVAAYQELAAATGLPDGLSAAQIGRLPDLMSVETATVPLDQVWQLLEPALDQALVSLGQMRRLEGERLAGDIRCRTAELERRRRQVAERAPGVVDAYRLRLQTRITDLLGAQASLVDEQRLAAEVALYADKCAIDEELVRLHSHLTQLEALVGLDEPIGKKLDFLVQEINREINTIGSKANDLDLTNQVVAMKSELEKIREQVQNLE